MHNYIPLISISKKLGLQNRKFLSVLIFDISKNRLWNNNQINCSPDSFNSKFSSFWPGHLFFHVVTQEAIVHDSLEKETFSSLSSWSVPCNNFVASNFSDVNYFTRVIFKCFIRQKVLNIYFKSSIFFTHFLNPEYTIILETHVADAR